MLRRAAVIGIEFEFALLRRIGDDPEESVSRAIEDALDSRWIRSITEPRRYEVHPRAIRRRSTRASSGSPGPPARAHPRALAGVHTRRLTTRLPPRTPRLGRAQRAGGRRGAGGVAVGGRVGPGGARVRGGAPHSGAAPRRRRGPGRGRGPAAPRTRSRSGMISIAGRGRTPGGTSDAPRNSSCKRGDPPRQRRPQRPFAHAEGVADMDKPGQVRCTFPKGLFRRFTCALARAGAQFPSAVLRPDAGHAGGLRVSPLQRRGSDAGPPCACSPTPPWWNTLRSGAGRDVL